MCFPVIAPGSTREASQAVAVAFSVAGRAYCRGPALGECRHRNLARCLIAVGRRAVVVVTAGERPQPRLPEPRWGGGVRE